MRSSFYSALRSYMRIPTKFLLTLYSAITATRYNCLYLQVKNILLTIYKYTNYLIYFQIITVEYIDHVVVCRIIQYANKNP